MSIDTLPLPSKEEKIDPKQFGEYARERQQPASVERMSTWNVEVSPDIAEGSCAANSVCLFRTHEPSYRGNNKDAGP